MRAFPWRAGGWRTPWPLQAVGGLAVLVFLLFVPGFAGIHYNLALVLLRMPGHEEEAARELEEFLRAAPDNQPARRILEAIRRRQR